jgi:tetratricopeptide (TPR) repeat protein
LIVDCPDSGDAKALFVAPHLEWPVEEQRLLLSFCDDWQVMEAENRDTLLASATQEYWRLRAVSYAMILFDDFSRDLNHDIIGHLEEMLQTRALSGQILSRLLVAPLRDPERVSRIIKDALSVACGGVAALFDSLRDLQPLLNRLASVWLRLPIEEFSEFSDRSEIWTAASRSGVLLEVLGAANSPSFVSAWNNLAFELADASPAQRAAIIRIGGLLGSEVFGGQLQRKWDYRELARTEAFSDEPSVTKGGTGSFVPLERVLRDVSNVLDALREGRDDAARRYRDDLVEKQLKNDRDARHAIKSLCNVAQRSAEMFRTDFERECLDIAKTLVPTDAYTLVQLGDHFKRVGRFNEALQTFESARPYVTGLLVEACIADVWSQQGYFDHAIRLYKQLPDWSTDESIRTAIADNLRRRGDLMAAEKEYVAIRSEWSESFRANVGFAEIARARGEFSLAQEWYESAMVIPKTDERDSRLDVYYTLAIARLLKLQAKLSEAYERVDGIVKKEPFFMPARILRGSILGLLGKESRGLEDIPPGHFGDAFGEWLANYHRGLLLLKLNHHSEARRQLVDNAAAVRATADEHVLLRLAAAMSFIAEGDMSRAGDMLEIRGEQSDAYVRYLRAVLELHVSIEKSDDLRIAQLTEQLKPVAGADGPFGLAFEALRSRDMAKAIKLEINLLCMAA